MTFTTRPYRTADLQNMLALVKSRPAEHITCYPSPADLCELLERPKIQEATRIWETTSGHFAGYALINYALTFADLAFEFVPEYKEGGIGDEMVAWGDNAYQERFHGQTRALTSSARDAQLERIALLEKHSFARRLESVVYMTRLLSELIPAPRLPEGFTIVPASQTEPAAWVTLFRAAMGTENMTVESRLAHFRVPDYDPELELVAITPDGTLAAYVDGAIHPEENALTGEKRGYTDPVGTHPAYQRRGLSRALLLEVLRRLQQRGMQTAHLGTSSANIAMQKAAESAGFRITGQSWHYAKKLRE